MASAHARKGLNFLDDKPKAHPADLPQAVRSRLRSLQKMVRDEARLGDDFWLDSVDRAQKRRGMRHVDGGGDVDDECRRG